MIEMDYMDYHRSIGDSILAPQERGSYDPCTNCGEQCLDKQMASAKSYGWCPKKDRIMIRRVRG